MTLMIFLRQLIPLDGQRTARYLMLLVPIGQQIEASVIDIVEILNVDMDFRARLQGFQRLSKLWQFDQSGRTIKVEINTV